MVAVLGFTATAMGFAVLAIPGVPLQGGPALAPLTGVGLGLGMLFVPTSRAALNATPFAYHGRTSAVLSVGRLIGAAVGAGLAGLALTHGASTSMMREALLVCCLACVLLGIPASTRLEQQTKAALGAGPAVLSEPAGWAQRSVR